MFNDTEMASCVDTQSLVNVGTNIILTTFVHTLTYFSEFRPPPEVVGHVILYTLKTF